jgi:hypothetical protein
VERRSKCREVTRQPERRWGTYLGICIERGTVQYCKTRPAATVLPALYRGGRVCVVCYDSTSRSGQARRRSRCTPCMRRSSLGAPHNLHAHTRDSDSPVTPATPLWDAEARQCSSSMRKSKGDSEQRALPRPASFLHTQYYLISSAIYTEYPIR